MKKYEREIRELLEKIDDFVPETAIAEREREAKKKVTGVMPTPPNPIPIRPQSRQTFTQWLRARNLSGAWAFIIFGFACLVVALIINQELPQFKIVAQVLGIVAAVAYLLPLLLRFFWGRDVNSDPKYWRGQAVEEEPMFKWGNVKQWFGRNRRKSNSKTNYWNDRNSSNRW